MASKIAFATSRRRNSAKPPRRRRRPPPKGAIKRVQFDPRAVKAFYERPLDDWRWIKDVPRHELLKEVPKGFRFHTRPHTHQLACFILCLHLPRFALFLDMGAGKSKIILDLIRYRKWSGELRGAMIGVPNLINLASWEEQIAVHAPDLTYRVLEGAAEERMQMMGGGPVDLYLINYAGLAVYMAQGRRRVRGGRQKKVITASDAKRFAELINFVELDEPQLVLSTTESLQYQMLRLLSWQGDYCYATTGTPMERDPTKLWPLMHVVDKGETLGDILPMFKAAFYTQLESRWHWSGFEYKFNPRKRFRLHQTLQHRSLRYKEEEWKKDGTAPTFTRIPVPMSKAQRSANVELVEEARRRREADEPTLNVFIKQRQLAAGFIAVESEADGTRLEVGFKPSPKVDAVENFLLELGPEKKLVIFHVYVYSGVLICELLERLKIKYAGVGHGFKDAKLQLSRFTKDPKYRVFVANCRAGGTGVDGLQHVCHTGLFFESPSAPGLRKQAVKRLDRDGQTKPVSFYDLVARGLPIDIRVLDSVEAGREIFDAVIDGNEEDTVNLAHP